MGLLELENAIVPVTGEFTKRTLRMSTISCKHCGGVIAVLVTGCTTEYQSKHTCSRCNGPICKYCAKVMHEQKGACSPLMAKIDFAIKHGWWNSRLRWRE